MNLIRKTITVLLLLLVAFVLQPSEAQAATTYNNGDVIEINSDEPIDRLYIIWDNIPGEWTLTVDGQEFTYGTFECIHEYVEPGVSGTNWKITIHKDNVLLNKVNTFNVGEALPDWVQIWNPPCEDADMVVFPTHADDELLFFAGTLPVYAGELKMAVQVVYLTHHWANGPHRVHELLNGLWTCGVTNYPIIGPFPDLYSKNNLEQAKGMYDTEAIKEFQTWVLRRFKPEVLIGHDINGEYGHSVHMLNTAMMMESVLLANDPEYMPEDVEKYGVWNLPKWYIHLYEENRLTFMWDEPLEAFDGKTGYEVATEAYQCHASQIKYNPVILRDDSNMSCLYFGLYRSTVGEDVVKDSFFENITVFSDDVIEEPEEPSTEPSTEPDINSEPDAENKPNEDENSADTNTGEKPSGNMDTTQTSQKNEIKRIIAISVVVVVVIMAVICIIRRKKNTLK